MKNANKKLLIEKFKISKLNNLSNVIGGNADDDHRTITLSTRACIPPSATCAISNDNN
ncbi:hypothetical protein [Psychroserpens algicola]|uniref:hypothetical protein n=1 Tax=Psychroserpens algicola TaxID=1719034 RepID=UPI0019533C23|nr:hypothetical protein [Psychroserpens algicola]